MKSKKVYKQPLVSVCIQTYQHAPYIKECLDSILTQETNFPFEILIGEDESKDGTREICKKYAEKYPDIIRLFLRNREDVIYIHGIPTGRANLIDNLKNASGKYIALCEGDDYWLNTDKLQKQADFMEAHTKYAATFHDTKIQTPGQNISQKLFGDLLKKELCTEDIIHFEVPFHLSSFFFKKEALPDLPKWFYEVPSGDTALFFLISTRGNFKYLPQITSIRRLHSEGITQTGNFKNNLRLLLNLIEMYRYFGDYSNWKYRKKINKVIRSKLIRLILNIDNLQNADIIKVFLNTIIKSFKAKFTKNKNSH